LDRGAHRAVKQQDAVAQQYLGALPNRKPGRSDEYAMGVMISVMTQRIKLEKKRAKHPEEEGPAGRIGSSGAAEFLQTLKIDRSSLIKGSDAFKRLVRW
jgi:hypothetical protein